ncbi:37 kDa salivary gland allergen Aed a 2-like [Anopheles ziemanni]|uniref:37 kDa salivary gland allergen Aed a 2-like n=1 Tax=Anopheles ziemanni TaxID=345580 RepID=UPI00265D971C|nr:37 kDa salivary gland allergen Aed a 2-like [Anopheles ziemanni]
MFHKSARTVKQCEKQMPASLKGRLCEIRQYKIFDGLDMEKHIECVMNALGFLDEEGFGDYHSLYEPLNAIKEDARHGFNLENCVASTLELSNTAKRAHGFYKCMLTSTSSDGFKKVFDLTELIKAGKLPQGSKYSKKVDTMMKNIDKKVCQ